jgi:hypothetical protein
MKAISLWEPWASAMALDIKRNETRSWSTRYRGDLLICAAQRPMRRIDRLLYRQRVDTAAGEGWKIPYGCAVAVVELYDCLPVADFFRLHPLSETERALGDYSSGRFIWLTRKLRRLSAPVPVKGRQQFFDVAHQLIAPLLP